MDAIEAPTLPRVRRDDHRARRAVVTPEGVPLNLFIGSAGMRLAALIIDLIIMGLVLVFGAYAVVWLGLSIDEETVPSLFLLFAFAVRNFYFIGFETGPRAATPGKRLVGLRVVARDGGRLTNDAVVARNLMRELEMFLPLTFLGIGDSADMLEGWAMGAGLLWSLTLSLFLLTNRDRMRVGDIIAGTWVVETHRRKLARDLSATAPDVAAITFTEAEMNLYGEFELIELERVLRRGDTEQMRTVADTIRAKMGRDQVGDDGDFLHAYYAALKSRLERGMLFGKRRADKHARP